MLLGVMAVTDEHTDRDLPWHNVLFISGPCENESDNSWSLHTNFPKFRFRELGGEDVDHPACFVLPGGEHIDHLGCFPVLGGETVDHLGRFPVLGGEPIDYR